MLDHEQDLEKRLLSAAWGTDLPNSVEKLAGDASTRVYFRALYPGKGSAIIMLQPHAGRDDEAVFLEIQEFLEALGLPVPRVYAHDRGQGLVVLEDLGDNLLELVVERVSPIQLREIYGEAVKLLLRMRRATSNLSSGCRAFYLAFDEAKLMEEMHFFLTHFVKGLCKIELSIAASSILEEFFLSICRTLAAQPRIFTHRDFHSRNLILHEKRLVMIDFQDARMGPAQYDLASLLRDSYVTLQEDLVEELLTAYMDEVRETSDSSRASFRHIFDVMSLQRNIKALGTFGYQLSVRGCGRYSSSIPRTAAYVSRNIGLYPEFARFRSAVEELICEPAREFL
ncbi:MAG: aminoglycoside phosphotransferase family protein [Desulfomonilaceae bacterium]